MSLSRIINEKLEFNKLLLLNSLTKPVSILNVINIINTHTHIYIMQNIIYNFT
jgi:hypothetical protein